MAKIGRFKNDEAEAAYLRAYQALEPLWPMPSTDIDVETSFGTTRVRRSGAGVGTPLLLFHPISGNGLAWHPFIEDLARDRVVYALDTIGTAGRSVQTAPMADAAGYAIWADEVMAGLGVDRAHLFGYSDGAWHAALVAVHKPQRVASLTIGEPGAALTKVRMSLLAKMILVAMRPTDANMAKFNEWLSPGVVLAPEEIVCAKASLGYQRRVPWQSPLKDEDLQAIPVPTLALFGSETKVGDVEKATHRLLTNVASAEVETFPGEGHGMLWVSPDKIIPRVLEFLAKHDRPVP